MIKLFFFILFFIVIGVFIGPFIYTVSAYELNTTAILLPPSAEHIFGTDRLGRDMLARILQGGQTSLIIGFLSATISSLIGLIVGILAGYFKGNIDKSITIRIYLFI